MVAAPASTWPRTSPRCSTPSWNTSSSTYGNSVLDLQSNKVDLAFALNPTPPRALSIGVHPPDDHPSVRLPGEEGPRPKTWDDLNKPEIRIVFDIGSLHETAARRYCPKAQLTGFKTRDECTLALQSGRADAQILAAMLGLAAVGKNPSLGPYHLLTDPHGRAAKLPRHPAGAGYAVRRGDQRLARLSIAAPDRSANGCWMGWRSSASPATRFRSQLSF